MKYDTLSHEARELFLWIDNTEEVFRQMVEPTVKTLARHWKRGNYSATKAVVAWRRVADFAAKHYAKTFSLERDWNRMFPVDTRNECASYMERAMYGSVFEEAGRIGNKKH